MPGLPACSPPNICHHRTPLQIATRQEGPDNPICLLQASITMQWNALELFEGCGGAITPEGKLLPAVWLFEALRDYLAG